MDLVPTYLIFYFFTKSFELNFMIGFDRVYYSKESFYSKMKINPCMQYDGRRLRNDKTSREKIEDAKTGSGIFVA